MKLSPAAHLAFCVLLLVGTSSIAGAVSAQDSPGSPPAPIATCPDGSPMPATGECPPPPPPPPPPPAEVPQVEAPRGFDSIVVRMATRLFVPSNFQPSSEYDSFGVIALSGPPTGATEDRRYKLVCEAYLTIFDDSVMVASMAPDVSQMITVWPRADLTEAQSFDPQKGDVHRECAKAISNYSYPAAHIWINKLEAHGAHANVGRGPFLVAWARSPQRARASGSVLTLDLSRMESQADIENAFRLWKNEIEKNPQKWNGAWKPNQWKLFVASALNAYGQQIIDAITIVKHVGFLG